MSTAGASGWRGTERESIRDRESVREGKKNEETGEARLVLEVNNEVSVEAVSQSVMTVTDFHLGGGDFKKTYKMRGE